MKIGGPDGIRTRDLSRDKGALFPLELLGRVWCTGMDLNHRNPGLQPGALPAELPVRCFTGVPIPGDSRPPPAHGPARFHRETSVDVLYSRSV